MTDAGAAPEPVERQPRTAPPRAGGRSPFEDLAAIARATAILGRGYRRYLAARQQAASADDPDAAA